MLQLVKRLAGLLRSRSETSASETSPSDRPSWRPGTSAPEGQGEAPKRFSTLLPGSTPALDAPGLIDEQPKDEVK